VTENDISAVVLDSAIVVHRTLGPGLLESVYSRALALELRSRGLDVEVEVPVDIFYKGEPMGLGFRADLIVGGKVLVELKSVEVMLPVHRKQVLTYLRAKDVKLGLLINFGAPLLKDGFERIANGL
jgi:GxxExxY protein